MYDGVITINFDPPYISLTGVGAQELKSLSQEQLASVLSKLGIEKLAMVDCLIRINGQFPVKILTDLGMLESEMETKS